MTIFELKKEIYKKAKRIGRKNAIDKIKEITLYQESISEKLASGTYPSEMNPLAVKALEEWVLEEDSVESEDPPPNAA